MRTTVRDLVYRVALAGQAAGLLAVGALAFLHHERERRDAAQLLLLYSRSLSFAASERFRDADRALKELAAGIARREGDAGVLNAMQAARRQAGFARLELTTPAGESLADTREWAEEVVAARAAPRPAALAVPVVRNGQVAYFLRGEIELAQLDALVEHLQLPAGWEAAIADPLGRVVTRAPPSGSMLGATLHPRVADALREQRSGWLDVVPASPASAHLAAYASVPPAGWSAIVAAPRPSPWAVQWPSPLAQAAVAMLLLTTGTAFALRWSRRPGQAIEQRQRNAEAEAALTARQLRSVMRMATDALIVSDAQDRVVLANDAATAMFAPGRRSLEGVHVGTLLAPETWLDYQTRPGDAVAVPGRGRRAGEPHFPIEYSVTRYTDLRGRMYRTLVVTDVTVRERQQESLQEAHGELRRVNSELERALIKEAENRQAATARELHDAVGSSLAGVSLLLGTAYSFIREPEAAALIAKSQEQVMMTTQQVRQISRGIMPVGQERGALVPALEHFAANLSLVPGITCTVRSRGDFEGVSPEIGGHLFRIVQEATTNALRHGHALRVRITLVRAGKWCRLTIRDDGRGCEPAAVSGRSAGIGMKSMRARAEAIGGRFSVIASPGRALKVQVSWLADGA